MKTVTAAVLTVATLGLSGCAKHGCDAAQLTRLETLLEGGSVQADMRGSIALQGIHEACGAHLPKGIDQALGALGSADPSMRATLMATALSRESGFMDDACGDFKRVFSSIAASDAASRSRLMYDGCRYAKLGLLSSDEFDALSTDASGIVLFGPPLYVWLIDHGVEQVEARSLIRASMNAK